MLDRVADHRGRRALVELLLQVRARSAPVSESCAPARARLRAQFRQRPTIAPGHRGGRVQFAPALRYSRRTSCAPSVAQVHAARWFPHRDFTGGGWARDASRALRESILPRPVAIRVRARSPGPRSQSQRVGVGTARGRAHHAQRLDASSAPRQESRSALSRRSFAAQPPGKRTDHRAFARRPSPRTKEMPR